jgi:hypothetical protein
VLDTPFRVLYTRGLMANSETKGTAERETRPIWRRPAVLWSVAAITLLLGYADLARGGEVIAPFLLVIGYCILVPMAILG